MKHLNLFAFAAGLAALLCGGSLTAEPLRMVLQWNHQSQFAGYYMALDKGFFHEENLDVELVSGGAEVNPLQLVKNGQADFCSAMLATILQSEQTTKNETVLLSQIINRSNLTLVAWKHGRNGSDLIETAADLNEKIITVWDTFAPPYNCFFDRYQIDAQILPQYYSVSLFLRKGADACCAMLYNEVHAIQQCHIPDEQLTVFNFYELGINFPEDGIYCTKTLWDAQPEICTAFVRACLKGWNYAQAHPEEALDAVMRRIEENKLSTNRAHMKWMLETVLASIFPQAGDDWTPGVLSKPDYDEAVSIMQKTSQSPLYNEFTTETARHGLH